MIKCNHWRDGWDNPAGRDVVCQEPGIVFELASTAGNRIGQPLRINCAKHYDYFKRDWEIAFARNAATFDEQEYLNDLLKHSL